MNPFVHIFRERSESMRYTIILAGLLFSLSFSLQSVKTQNWKAQLDMAGLLANENKLDSAIVLAQSALHLAENEASSSETSIGEILHALGDLCFRRDRTEEASRYYDRAVGVRQKVFGGGHIDVLRSRAGYLSATGMIRMDERKFSEAERMLVESLDIREKIYGPSHFETGWGHMHLGQLFHTSGAYHFAEAHYKRALEIWKAEETSKNRFLAIKSRALPAQSAMGPGNYASLLWDQGRYAEAEKIFEESVAFFERVNGPLDESVVAQLVRISWLYEDIGRYEDSERVLKRALSIREQKYPAGDYHIGLSLERLGWLYINQENVLQAKQYTERAAEIFKKSGEQGHPNLCLALINLGILAHVEGRKAESEAHIAGGLRMSEAYRDLSTPQAEWALHSIGIVLMGFDRLGKNPAFLHARMPAEAATVLEAAASYWEDVASPKHPHRLQILREVAVTYSRMGRYALADSLFRIVDTVNRELLGPDHPLIAENDELSGLCLRMQGRYSDALKFADRAMRIRRKNFLDASIILSERDALSNARLLQRTASNFLSCFADGSRRAASESRRAASIVLASKGVVTEALAKRWSSIPESEPELKALRERQRQVKGRISRLHVKGPDDRDPKGYKGELDSLSQIDNEIERELARRSRAYQAEENMGNVTSDLIVQFLPQNAVLIEYVKYDYLDLPSEHKVERYMVVLLRRYRGPVVIDLGTAARIEDVLERYRDHLLALAGAKNPPTKKDQMEYRAISNLLVGLIWKPIEEQLGERELVFVAPDGGLNLLSFGGLVDEDGKYLIEQHAFHYLSAARDLISMQQSYKPGSGLLAIGDPDYDAPVEVRLLVQREVAGRSPSSVDPYASRNVRTGCGRLNELVVSRLNNTRVEVETISSFWPDAFESESVSMHTGLDATEEAVKTSARGKRVIHLATHGYYIQADCERSGPKARGIFPGENPLLQSGLFLAGANLHGEGAAEADAEDGILTALEVSTLDLRGTELVVLSACETGLGEVKQWEGVYGLRRAFQMAGARTVVSALWQVPDEETMKFMKDLYAQKATTYPELIQKVALRRINELKLRRRPTHPYTWGAFVATGDWRLIQH